MQLCVAGSRVEQLLVLELSTVELARIPGSLRVNWFFFRKRFILMSST